MRTDVERQALLETVVKLFPDGATNAGDMASVFSEAKLWDVALTRTLLLTRRNGKNNFIVGYLATVYVDKKGEIVADSFCGSDILRHPAMERIQTRCGIVDELEKLNFKNYPNAGLIADKLSPLDIPRLRMDRFRDRRFFISPQTITLAKEGVDVVLPKDQMSFEVVPLQGVVESLQEQLLARHWYHIYRINDAHLIYRFHPLGESYIT